MSAITFARPLEPVKRAIIIGGSSKGVVGGRGAYHMSDVDRLVGVELKRIDEDFLLTGYCSKE